MTTTTEHQAAEEKLLRGIQLIGGPPYGPWTDLSSLDEALEAFQSATKANSQYGLPHLYLGIARMMNQDAQKASMSFDAALELMPDCALAYTYRAWVQDDEYKAVEDFRRASNKANHDWLPEFELARYRQYRSQHETAVGIFSKSIAKGA